MLARATGFGPKKILLLATARQEDNYYTVS